MVEAKYSRFHIATKQLESAIGLFISGQDRFSVIALAGAADDILVQLIRRAGKTEFAEYMLLRANHKQDTACPTNGEVQTQMNNALKINAVKHFDKQDKDTLLIDPEECAFGAIMKAIANLKELLSDKEALPSYVSAMYGWIYKNSDIMKKYNIGNTDAHTT